MATIKEIHEACEKLIKIGCGDYGMTVECGYSGIGAIPDYIDHECECVNMEGESWENIEEHGDKKEVAI